MQYGHCWVETSCVQNRYFSGNGQINTVDIVALYIIKILPKSVAHMELQAFGLRQ